jgi:hypothetical protein
VTPAFGGQYSIQLSYGRRRFAVAVTVEEGAGSPKPAPRFPGRPFGGSQMPAIDLLHAGH